MGFRFHRSFKIAPGLRINLGKKGASFTIGPRGAKMTIGSTGTRVTAGIPGTGLSYTEKLGSQPSSQNDASFLTECPYCGHHMRRYWDSCPQCHHSLTSFYESAPEAPTVTYVECPNCHAQLEPGTNFCPKCGTKLSPSDTHVMKKAAAAGTGCLLPLALFIILLVCLAL